MSEIQLHQADTLRARAADAAAVFEQHEQRLEKQNREQAAGRLREEFIAWVASSLDTAVEADDVLIFKDAGGYPAYAASPVGLGPELFFACTWRDDLPDGPPGGRGLWLLAPCPVCKSTDRVWLPVGGLRGLHLLLADLKQEAARNCQPCARKQAARDAERRGQAETLRPPPSPAEDLAAALRRVIVAEVVALREEGL